MLPEVYEYSKNANLKQYEFYSTGPKGKIRKLISYSFIGTWDGHRYYNLGFGDYDQSGNKVLDLVVGDNKDADKVLATVAATAVDFFKHHPNCGIIIEGSTSARTRLYKKATKRGKAKVSNLPDLSNDPFFVKKAESAKKLLEQYGTPKF
jgi:hypothetical protein